MRLSDQLSVFLVPLLCLGLIGFAWWLLREDSPPAPEPVPGLSLLCDERFRQATTEVAEAFERRGRGEVDARYLPAGELPQRLVEGRWDLVVVAPGAELGEVAARVPLAPLEPDEPGRLGAADEGFEPREPALPRAHRLESAADPELADAFARFFNGAVGREALLKHRPAN